MAVTSTSRNPIILYGIEGHYADITLLVLCKCIHNGTLYIPRTESLRTKLFGDPIFGTLKHIRIVNQGKSNVYPATAEVSLNVELKGNHPFDNPKWWHEFISSTPSNPYSYLTDIHKYLLCVGGNMEDESCLQLISVQYINNEAKVLELGGNIGRTSIIIGSLLKDSKNLVTLEPDTYTFSHLERNKQLNHLDFGIENAALFARKVFIKGSETYTEEMAPKSAIEVKTVTLKQLEDKYNMVFDTLVVDCEGFFYYTIMENIDVLDNIKTLILKNDYWDTNYKFVIDMIVKGKGFTKVYNKQGGWGPCSQVFYEVWTK